MVPFFLVITLDTLCEVRFFKALARALFGIACSGMHAAGAVARGAAAWTPSSRPAPGAETPAPGVPGGVALASSSSARKAVATELQTSLSRRTSSLQRALQCPAMVLYNMP